MNATHEVSSLLAVAQRDLIKMLRDRTRMAVNLAFPIMLFVGLGSVLRPTVGKVTGLDTVTLAFTGVLPATLFQSAAAGMVSLVEDRENDFSREMFVAPVSRLTLVCGKIAGESLVAVFQGCCVVLAALVFGVGLGAAQLARMAAPCLGCCLLGAAFGLAALAAVPNQRAAMQVFQFLIIPQYVLAGVIVPVHALPSYLAVIARAMPLRYAVDLTRAAYYAGSSGYQKVVQATLVTDTAVTVALFVGFVLVGKAVFDYRDHSR
jgi:ABC-2 type transport system permease protein